MESLTYRLFKQCLGTSNSQFGVCISDKQKVIHEKAFQLQLIKIIHNTNIFLKIILEKYIATS